LHYDDATGKKPDVSQTACLGVLNGLHIDLPDPKALPGTKDEWVVVLGGASSVGKYAIQVILFSLHPREPSLM